MAEQEKRSPSIHIRVPVENYKHLQQVAKAMDRPVSYLVAQILHEWVQRPKGADPTSHSEILLPFGNINR